jgi:hypothetical protein
VGGDIVKARRRRTWMHVEGSVLGGMFHGLGVGNSEEMSLDQEAHLVRLMVRRCFRAGANELKVDLPTPVLYLTKDEVHSFAPEILGKFGMTEAN